MSIAHRLTGLPEGWDSVVGVTEERQASFQDFTYAQRALWDVAWETRQVQLYGAMPDGMVWAARLRVPGGRHAGLRLLLDCTDLCCPTG